MDEAQDNLLNFLAATVESIRDRMTEIDTRLESGFERMDAGLAGARGDIERVHLRLDALERGARAPAGRPGGRRPPVSDPHRDEAGVADGTEVEVRLVKKARKPSKPSGKKKKPPESLAERYADFIGSVKDLPADMSVNLDHYLYGHPKRK